MKIETIANALSKASQKVGWLSCQNGEGTSAAEEKAIGQAAVFGRRFLEMYRRQERARYVNDLEFRLELAHAELIVLRHRLLVADQENVHLRQRMEWMETKLRQAEGGRDGC